MKTLAQLVAAATISFALAGGANAHSDCGTQETKEQSTTGAAAVEVGDLSLTNARSRAMLAGQKVGGGYVTIENAGKADDRLISVSSTRADRMEVHEMAMQDGVMKMRKLNDGLPLPAGQNIELKPGGNHLMFFGIEKPFTEGETIPVEFTFEKAGKITVDLITTPAASAQEKKQH